MKKILFWVMMVGLCFNNVVAADLNGLKDSFSRVYFKYQDTPGYIFFEGFDFNGYKAESDGIEPMLEKTLELLQKYYGKNGEVAQI